MRKLLIFSLLVFVGCKDTCESTRTYTMFEPVYKSLATVRSEFRVAVPEPIQQSGKIYLYGTYLFINEVGKGVHILDNSNPADPQNLTFINIPGNFDIAVKDNILYADSYVDLLAIDISDVNNIQLVTRLGNAFPGYNIQYGFEAEGDNVIVDWVETEKVEMLDHCQNSGVVLLSSGFAMSDVMLAEFSASPGGVQGVGGSLARFAIQQQFLYAVDMYDMHVFNVTDAANPTKENVTNIGWDIETIFPYKDKVFIGAQSGMFIMDCSNPADPQLLSQFTHATACDPVVANDEYAYVTLRSGSECNGFTNQLDIINVQNITQPFLVRSVPMDNPYGLGLDGNTLFVCEGEFGLKVFDVTDPENPSLSFTEKAITVHDVIPWNGVLMAIGEEGLYQYDYSDLANIQPLSFVAFEPLESE